MTIYDSDPGMCYGTMTKMLSKEDKERIKQILDELREIFDCESIGMYVENMSLHGCDYVIKMYNSNIGESWRKGR